MLLKNIFVYPKFPENLKKLISLAYNIWTLWDSDATRIFYRIDPSLFRSVNKNPVAFLHSIPEERLLELSQDKSLLYDLEKIWKKYENYIAHKAKYSEILNGKTIAYFSMEYGLHQSIPIYAGGLGILAGDHLKGASDIGIPIIGIGLFYRYGYFNQRINLNGVQEELYRENRVYYMPVKELKTEERDPVYVTLTILNKPLTIKVWYVTVGKAKILLLDTNIMENPEEFRRITEYLYVAEKEVRLMQEIVLGCGGLMVLDKMKMRPDIYHLNEGHSAFLLIERLNTLINKEKLSFEEAFAFIKNTTVFTTHTPVEAGNENYPVEMIKKYLEERIKSLGIPFERFVNYGIHHDSKIFWLPAFAIRFSNYVNGVSKLHTKVSRNMWKALFPQREIREIPITSITNGVHYSWLSNNMRELFERYLGPDYIHESTTEEVWERIHKIPDEEIWEAHQKRKREMISFLRRTTEAQYIEKGYAFVKIKRAQEMLNTDYLTIGFARRFATYKRPTLLIKDKERLKKILTITDRPAQILFSGKAHPADFAGKNMIKEIFDFAREFGLEDRVIFIENYTRDIAAHLVQGVDVWLNTPVKLLEASGTSGIKAGINGVLNLSVLDGWWPEGYNEKNGWAITAGDIYADPELRDMAEANQIYDLLEEEILPLYYNRDERNIPLQWVEMMKDSIYFIYRNFNINRMLSEYCEKSYLSILQKSQRLLENNNESLKEIIRKASKLNKFWDKVNIKDVFVDIDKKEIFFINDTLHVDCYVYLDDADPSLLEVELFYVRENEQNYETVQLNFVEKYQDKTGKYEGTIVLKYSGIQSIYVRLVPADGDIQRLYPDLVKWRDV